MEEAELQVISENPVELDASLMSSLLGGKNSAGHVCSVSAECNSDGHSCGNLRSVKWEDVVDYIDLLPGWISGGPF